MWSFPIRGVVPESACSDGKTTNTSRHCSRCQGRDTNRGPPKYESTLLPLCQSVSTVQKQMSRHSPELALKSNLTSAETLGVP